MKSISNNNDVKKLEDRVVLIINGLSESGRVLAKMLTQQGADVAIVDSRYDAELTRSIRHEVQTNGQRCLVLTPATVAVTEKRPFSQVAIQKIIQTLGGLDAFISYTRTLPPDSSSHQNGHLLPPIFDQEGLAKAALKHILT